MPATLGSLDVSIPCPKCPEPFRVRVGTQAVARDPRTLDVSIDSDGLRTAIRAHVRQHEVERDLP